MPNYHCGHCTQHAFSTNPAAYANSSIEWINLLERGVSAVCPSCGVIYSVAKIVANTPRFSPEARNVAGMICGVLLFLAGVNFVDKLIDRVS